MSEQRWIPIVAAVVGLLGGIGGAAIGGSIANKGQKQRFKDERRAELNNLLIETYSRYLTTTARTHAVALLGDVSPADERRLVGDVLSAEAEVRFVTDDGRVEAAAAQLKITVLEPRLKEYENRRDAFIDAAERSLFAE